MMPRTDKDEQRFALVFESLKAAQEQAPEGSLVRLMTVPVADDQTWEKIDELRRLAESISEPEMRTYTAS